MDKIKTAFDTTNYRSYLQMRLPTSGAQRGARSKLAEALRCQTAFVSRVLHGEAHFSLEHAVVINRFLGHTESEGDYFILLVHYARAGTRELEAHYLKQIRQIQEKRQIIAERIQVKEALTPEDQARYYSSWYYAAVHVCLLLPELRTPERISMHLQLPEVQIKNALDFLCSVGMAIQKGAHFVPGATNIHLGKDSPMVGKHHQNWRLQAMQVIDRAQSENLFYSAAMCISEKDAQDMKEALLKLLEQFEPAIERSPEEAVFCMNFDFFRLGQNSKK